MDNHVLAEHIRPPSDNGTEKESHTRVAWEEEEEEEASNENNLGVGNMNNNIDTTVTAKKTTTARKRLSTETVSVKKTALMSPSDSITKSTTNMKSVASDEKDNTTYKTMTAKEKEKDIMSQNVKENSARNSANINLAEAICTSIKDNLHKSAEEVDGYTNKRIEEVETSEREHFYKMAAFENEMNQLQGRFEGANIRENEHEKIKDTNNKQILDIRESIAQLREMENSSLPKEGETLDKSKAMLTSTIKTQMDILDSLKKQRDDIITEFTMGIQAYKNLGIEVSSVKEDSYLSIKFTMIDPTNPSRPFIVGLRLEGEKPSWSYRLHICSPVLPENKAEILVEVLNQSTPKDGGGDSQSFQPFASFLKAIRKEFKALV